MRKEFGQVFLPKGAPKGRNSFDEVAVSPVKRNENGPCCFPQMCFVDGSGSFKKSKAKIEKYQLLNYSKLRTFLTRDIRRAQEIANFLNMYLVTCTSAKPGLTLCNSAIANSQEALQAEGIYIFKS